LGEMIQVLTYVFLGRVKEEGCRMKEFIKFLLPPSLFLLQMIRGVCHYLFLR